MDKETVSVFYSYSHRDEELRIELWKHLSALRREGLISDWHDQNIDAGDAWDERIRAQLTGADLILLLVSADFLASEYCYGNELAIALERHRQGKTIVVPIMLRSIDWPSTPFSHLKPLPRNRVPITAWNDCDTAFTSVARDLRKIVDEIIGKKQGRRSLLGRLKQCLRPRRKPDVSVNTPAAKTDTNVTGLLRVLIECPTCSRKYYTTALYAGSKYRCRGCGCIEAIPHELMLWGMAAAQGKLPREVLIKAVTRQLAHSDLPFTFTLLLKETRTPNDSVDELTDDDIIKKTVIQGAIDLSNYIAAALRHGLLPEYEARLEQAIAESDVPESEDAHKITDALLNMAKNDQEHTQRANAGDLDDKNHSSQMEDTSSAFKYARILCLYSEHDAVLGQELVSHLIALERSEMVTRVNSIVVDSQPECTAVTEDLIAPYHAVVLLLSPNMIMTRLMQNRGMQALFERHEHRDILLIPVIVQPMVWQKLMLSRLQVLPIGGKPVQSWSSTGEACANVAYGVQKSVAKLPPEIIVKVAERSDVEAMNHMWMCYALGQGVRKNLDKMLYWLERAASTGRQPWTMFTLSLALETRAPEEAQRWMSEAAAAGYGPAMRQMAFWFENGTCVPQDDVQAFKWCLKAAEAGEQAVILPLAGRYFEGKGTEPDFAKGNAWLARGAEDGNAMAMVHLGNSYNIGRGVDRDENKAREWWQKAAESGDEEVAKTLRDLGYFA